MIVALALFVVSATDVAVSVTVAGEGTAPGAVYLIAVPDALVAAEIIPQVAAVQPVPDSAQVTPWFAESPVTVAVKLEVPLTTTIAVVCESETATPAVAPAVIVIVAAADFVPSVTDVAVIVTVAGLGTVPGAVYMIAVPDALVVADSEPQPFAVAHERAQVTPLLALSFVTVAVTACIFPAATLAVVGASVTVTAFELEFPVVPEVEFEPPPQPASPIAIAATVAPATAKILRQLRCPCVRTITLLQFLVVSFSGLPGDWEGRVPARLPVSISLAAVATIAADTPAASSGCVHSLIACPVPYQTGQPNASLPPRDSSRTPLRSPRLVTAQSPNWTLLPEEKTAARRPWSDS